MEFKKILVPVDGSDPSMNAFHCALDLAKAHKTEMILLYVIDANEMFYATNQVMLSGEFFETMKGVGTKLIEKLVSEIPEDVPHKSICVVGIPGETASDIAKSEKWTSSSWATAARAHSMLSSQAVSASTSSTT